MTGVQTCALPIWIVWRFQSEIKQSFEEIAQTLYELYMLNEAKEQLTDEAAKTGDDERDATITDLIAADIEILDGAYGF